MNEDKDFSTFLSMMTIAYGIKCLCGLVGKAFDNGYDTSLKINDYGKLKFTRGADVKTKSVRKEPDENSQERPQKMISKEEAEQTGKMD